MSRNPFSCNPFINRIISFAYISLFSLASSAALALDSDPSQPVTIDANTASSNGISETTIYKGNVLVKQGSLNLSADSVTIQMRNNKLVSIIARGNNVKLSQRPRPSEGIVTASGSKISYNIKQQTAVIEGGAKLEQEGRKLTSPKITYDFKRKLVEANPSSSSSKGGRVHVVIPPANQS